MLHGGDWALLSAAIAMFRRLVLPALGLRFLPRWLGNNGVFIAIPLAEALTFVLALMLVAAVRPSKIVAALDAGEGGTKQP